MSEIIVRATRANPYESMSPNGVVLYQHLSKEHRLGDLIQILKFSKETVTIEELEKLRRIHSDDRALTIERDVAQTLIDDLWDCGLRPTRGDTGGAVDAIKYHLEDMRKLVFKEKK